MYQFQDIQILVLFLATFGIFHNFFSPSTFVKKVLPEWPPEGPWLLSSRVMSIFAITSHQYTITLYTPGHLQISWDVFAKKSADILSFRNSFITISNAIYALALQRSLIILVRLRMTWYSTPPTYAIIVSSKNIA